MMLTVAPVLSTIESGAVVIESMTRFVCLGETKSSKIIWLLKTSRVKGRRRFNEFREEENGDK